MFEGTQKPSISNEKAPLISFRDAAFLASALLVLTPEGAKAWDNADLIPQSQIEKIFDEINLPSLEELENVTVTHVRPSQSGKYIVHIRQEHRMVDVEYSPEDLKHTGVIQGEIYKTIRAIEDRQTGTTYLPEGYSDAFISELLIPEARSIKEFRQVVAAHIEDLAAHEVSLTDLVREYGAEHIRKTGATFSRVMYGEFVAIGWYMLDIALSSKGITVDDDMLGTLKSLVGNDPETYLNFYQGGLVRAYNNGHIIDVAGCENHDLFKSNMSYDDVLAINPKREKNVADCFMNQLQQTMSSYVVTVYGGAHNFEQEIPEGTGYIVLTPKGYSSDEILNTID